MQSPFVERVLSQEPRLSVFHYLPSLFICLLALDGACAIAQAADQKIQTPPTATTSSTQQSEIPDVPGISADLHGFNAGISISSFHDSITGWATLATPAVGYSLNDHFNFDVTVPIYFYRLAQSRAARPRANALLVNQRGEVGDVVLSFHSAFSPRFADYQVTGAVTAPTGDAEYGLSTGRVTFDVTNHFERTFRRLTPTLEIGMGDSTALVNRLVTKNYTSLGPLAHFQTGISFELPRSISFELDAYEQLPVGDQKTYGPSRNGKTTVVTGRNITEDNGFISSIDVPLTPHATLTSYYTRSLRLHNDNVAIGISYVLRQAPRVEEPEPDLDEIFR